MQFAMPERWPTSKEEALADQKENARAVRLIDNLNRINLVGAIDTAYGTNAETIYAAAVVLSFPDLTEVTRAYHFEPVRFPYLPGLFYYREGPAMLGALAKLDLDPDVIIVHGHGIAHPRKCGAACQIGLVVDRPTVGCARKLLTGRHRPVTPAKGSLQPIIVNAKESGYAYRSKENVKPIFISPGYRCDIEHARDIIVKNLRGFRLPEPLRLAHLFANKYRRRSEATSNGDKTVAGDTD